MGASLQPSLKFHLAKSHPSNQGAASRPSAGKAQMLPGRDEGREPEPWAEKDFFQDFSPSFGSSGALPALPAEAVPFPSPPAALEGARSRPSRVPLPPRPSAGGSSGIPIPAIPTQSQILALLRYLLYFFFFCFLNFKKYKVYAPKRGTKNGGLFLSWLLHQTTQGRSDYHLQRQRKGKNWSKKTPTVEWFYSD